ncbi:hypothetical protein NNO_1580 [Hydrogenimonas sp.]|nr:hypothetical protein NNO_1580 [Hydrogenimonas sp.]
MPQSPKEYLYNFCIGAYLLKIKKNGEVYIKKPSIIETDLQKSCPFWIFSTLPTIQMKICIF